MSIDKVYSSADDAVADIPDGATIMIGGFGMVGVPMSLIFALGRRGARDLTIIANGVHGRNAAPDGSHLIINRQVKKFIGSFPFSGSPSQVNDLEEQYNRDEIEIEVVAQGTMAERIRAAGAGVGAFYVRTGLGTIVAQGKEARVIDGVEYLLEYPLHADYAFVKAYKADPWGNLTYRLTARNFNPIMAAAATCTIAEVQEVVPLGSLDPETIVTPSVFVNRVVVAPREVP